MNKKIAVSACIATLTLVGCSHTAPRYGLSPENQITLKTLKTSKRVAVGPFTSSEPGKQSIVCRAAGPVEAPDGKTFDAYLREALINELRIADVLDEKSSVVIKGYLEHIDFNSNIGAGKWIIRLTMTAPGTQPFTIENTYGFSTNFIADQACAQVAQALLPATQDLYQKLFAQPQFQSLLR